MSPEAIPFRDNKGHVIEFDPRMTIADLVKRGIKIELVKKDAPLPDGVYRSIDKGAEPLD